MGMTIVAVAFASTCGAHDAEAPAWRPSASLARMPDATFTLYAVTLTPDACHRAGPAVAAAPAAAEVGIVLHVTRADGGDCPSLTWPVYHVVRGLRRDERANVRVTLVLNGDSLATSRVAFDGAVADSAWTPGMRAVFPP